jgi:hypothetical protein
MVETYLGIQLVATLFALFMIYVAFLHYKRKNMQTFELVYWIITWLTVIYLALFPKSLDPLIKKFFVARALDLIMLFGFMIMAYLGFANHMGVKSLQRDIEILVRKLALKNAKTKR